MTSCELCAGSSRCPACHPTPDGPTGVTATRLAAILAKVRAGRCTLRAAECGWTEDCTRHHPDAKAVAS